MNQFRCRTLQAGSVRAPPGALKTDFRTEAVAPHIIVQLLFLDVSTCTVLFPMCSLATWHIQNISPTTNGQLLWSTLLGYCLVVDSRQGLHTISSYLISRLEILCWEGFQPATRSSAVRGRSLSSDLSNQYFPRKEKEKADSSSGRPMEVFQPCRKFSISFICGEIRGQPQPSPESSGSSRASATLPRAEWPLMASSAVSLRKPDATDFLFSTQKELIVAFRLPRAFRFRYLRRHVLSISSKDQQSFIRKDALSVSCLLRSLPRRVTKQQFAIRCLVLAFHFSMARGAYPGFWAQCDQTKLVSYVPSEILRCYHPQIGVLIHQRRCSTSNSNEPIERTVSGVRNRALQGSALEW